MKSNNVNRDYKNLMNEKEEENYSEYAYDFYKFNIEEGNSAALGQLFGNQTAVIEENEVHSEDNSDNSNRESRSENEYPDSDAGKSEDEGDPEEIAKKEYEKNVESFLSKYLDYFNQT